MEVKKGEKYSPLKGNFLRYPGQSLLLESFETIFIHLAVFIGFCGVAMGFIIAILLNRIIPKQYIEMSRTCWVGVFFLTGFYLAYKTLKEKKRFDNLILANHGEREVAFTIDELRENGYRVFHDVICTAPSGEFNIDHVMIGPTGIYVLETKTRRKTKGLNEQIEVTRDSIKIGNKTLKAQDDPRRQAEMNAQMLRKIFHEHTGENPPVNVQPLVVYPGWFINIRERDLPTMVLNPGQIESYLRNRSNVLNEVAISKLSKALFRYQKQEMDRRAAQS